MSLLRKMQKKQNVSNADQETVSILCVVVQLVDYSYKFRLSEVVTILWQSPACLDCDSHAQGFIAATNMQCSQMAQIITVPYSD